MASELLASVQVRTGQTSGGNVGASAGKTTATTLVTPARQTSSQAPGKNLPVVVQDKPQSTKETEAQNAKQLAAQVTRLNEFAQQMKRDIEFSVDQESNRTIIRVRDTETGEVIRQLPPEEILRIAERLAEAEGLLVREQA